MKRFLFFCFLCLQASLLMHAQVSQIASNNSLQVQFSLNASKAIIIESDF